MPCTFAFRRQLKTCVAESTDNSVYAGGCAISRPAKSDNAEQSDHHGYTPAPKRQLISPMCRRGCSSFNPLAHHDVELFQAVMEGEHCLRDFTNRDIPAPLPADNPGRFRPIILDTHY